LSSISGLDLSPGYATFTEKKKKKTERKIERDKIEEYKDVCRLIDMGDAAEPNRVWAALSDSSPPVSCHFI
jgi:hypothetical protein